MGQARTSSCLWSTEYLPTASAISICISVLVANSCGSSAVLSSVSHLSPSRAVTVQDRIWRSPSISLITVHTFQYV